MKITRPFAVVVALLAMSIVATSAFAASVNLTVSDGFGTTSFNTGDNWSDSTAPGAGNDYVTNDLRLRTPSDSGSYTFGGDSFTVNNTNGLDGGLMYKGNGAAGVITIDSLLLDGGTIAHQSAPGDVFQLAGNINVASDSVIHAKQGPIEISAVLSGAGSITNTSSDNPGIALKFLSPSNTFTGDIINNGRFELVDGGVLNFVIGASGVNNSVSGSGAETDFNGDFAFDLTGASASFGDSWAIASATTQSFGSMFNVLGFTESSDVWTNGNYQFSETTGELTVVPEPTSLLLAAVSLLVSCGLRRRS